MVQDHIYKGLDIIFSSKILSKIICSLLKKENQNKLNHYNSLEKLNQTIIEVRCPNFVVPNYELIVQKLNQTELIHFIFKPLVAIFFFFSVWFDLV
jgi:hypothetical protein